MLLSTGCAWVEEVVDALEGTIALPCDLTSTALLELILHLDVGESSQHLGTVDTLRDLVVLRCTA